MTDDGVPAGPQGDIIKLLIDATIDGDFLSGEIRYEAATVDVPACEPLDGCASVQAFNGTRPPD